MENLTMEIKETLNDVIEECVDAYITESAEHFLNKLSTYRDDGRYFYSKSECRKFFNKFKSMGGKMEDVHVEKIIEDGRFFCYEVSHAKGYKTHPECYYPTFVKITYGTVKKNKPTLKEEFMEKNRK